MGGKHFKTSSSAAPNSEQTGRIPVQGPAQAPRLPAPIKPPIGGFAPRASPDDTFAFISAAGSPAEFTPIDTSDLADDDRFASTGNKEEFYDFGYAVGGDDSSHKSSHRRKKRSKKKKVWPVVVGVLVVLLIAVGGCGFMLVRSAQGVRADAKTVLTIVDGMGSKIISGDSSGISDDAQQVVVLSARMKDEVSGPLWTVASFVPVYGEDITAARKLASVLDAVAAGALVPISDELSQNPVGKLIQDGGVINVAGVQTLADVIVEVAPVLKEASVEVEGIGKTHIGKVTELVDKAKGVFAAVGPLADSASEIAPLLPAMLGADGEARNYIVAAENNAEIRTLGGFTGAAGVMTIDNGAISFGQFEGKQIVDDPAKRARITISDEEMELFQPYDPTLNYTSGDSYFVPDFPRGSEILATLWSSNHGDQVIDGVIAIDPVFLNYVLGLVGGVEAIDGTYVDGSNASQVLLSDVYWKYPSGSDAAKQDAVFASVADGAFHQLIDNLGDNDLPKLGEVFARGASEGRLLAWMANPEEEALMVNFGLDGALPTEASDPVAGLYVNNYSYSKLDWYLQIDTQVGERKSHRDGSATYQIEATLTNTMTKTEEERLPDYVSAQNGNADVPSQEMLRLYLYAPMGGSITDVRNSYGGMTEATHNGLQVFYNDIRMKPGESVTVSYIVTVPAEGADKDLEDPCYAHRAGGPQGPDAGHGSVTAEDALHRFGRRAIDTGR